MQVAVYAGVPVAIEAYQVANSWACRVVQAFHFHRRDYVRIVSISEFRYHAWIKVIKSSGCNNRPDILPYQFILLAEIDRIQWSACFHTFIAVDARIKVNCIEQRNRLAHRDIDRLVWRQVQFKWVWNIYGADFGAVTAAVAAVRPNQPSFLAQLHLEVPNETFYSFNIRVSPHIDFGVTRRVNHFRCEYSYTTVHRWESFIKLCHHPPDSRFFLHQNSFNTLIC